MSETVLRRRSSSIIGGQRRRAAESGQVLDYGLDDLRIRIKEALSLPCRYCRCLMGPCEWTCDHARPVSRNGSFGLWNVEVICRRCNEHKGALTAEEFAALLSVMNDWTSEARTDVLGRLRLGGKAKGQLRRR